MSPPTTTAHPFVAVRHDCADLCQAYTWTIADEELVAGLVAQVAAGYYKSVLNVIGGLGGSTTPLHSSAFDAALAKLAPPATPQARWHRDGWIFQLIMWLAMVYEAETGEVVRQPQFRKAEHGLDGLIVRLRADGPVHGVVICEQKATEDPRALIRDEVWKEITDYESGVRDNELVGEVTALLQATGGNADELVKRIFWDQQRFYRVSVSEQYRRRPLTAAVLRRLFGEYQHFAPGHVERRPGETIHIPDIRNWMDGFIEKVSRHLLESKSRV